MPLVGVNNEPLLERAIFGFDGTDYRVVKVDAAGQLLATVNVPTTITVTQATAANLNATATLAANQNVQARNYGWINAAWQKDAARIGYSNTVQEAISNLSLAAGTNTLTGTAVPAGKVWIITNFVMRYDGTITNVVLQAQKLSSAVAYNLAAQKAPVSALFYDRQGSWVLKPGEQMQLSVFSATLNDDAYFQYVGYSFDIDQ